jgi:hypothetical protein
MMQNTAYRLAEYKIIANKHGELWWETHIGLASLKTGKCFINGDILFLVPSDITEPGFLKGEFLDHLNRMPKWNKTKYYCASYKISECKSVSPTPLFGGIDSRLKNEVNLQPNGSTQAAAAKTSLKPVKAVTAAHIAYKLGRYEITEMNNGQLFWKSTGGLGSLKMGRCHIRGSILFLEPGKTEQSGLKIKEFLQQLNQLPDWIGTKYFCARYAIYYSSTGAVCRRLGEEKDLNRTGTQNVVVNRKAYRVGINIKPIIANKSAAKDKLKAFLSFCKLLVILILKLLFAGSQIVYTISRTFINRWKRSRG